MLKLLFLIPLFLPISTFGQNKIVQPARGSVERKIHMDLLRKEFTPKFNGQQLIFEVNANFYQSDGNWAFIYVNVFQPGGDPVDFRNSKFRKEFEKEMIDSNGIFALFKKANGTWLLLAHADFPTDVPIGCWWKEYKAPKQLFGSAASEAVDCN